ncbi:MAG: epoxyqueuosine reductase QueH [Patescibacteria group bacterium]|nr:epoxyqueuosine reductase QueH [Patescibacteria group bacterium]
MRQNIYYPFNRLRLLQSLFVLSWATLIGALLSVRTNGFPKEIVSIPFSDKVVHFVLFGFLARLIAGWFKRHTTLDRKTEAIIGCIVAATYAFCFEVIQDFLPYRSASFYDWLFGALGALAVSFVWYRFQVKQVIKPKLLLHACCGPCGSYLTGELKKEFEIFLYFANSNIDTNEEFERRWQQVKKIAKYYGLPAVSEIYNHQEWLEKVKGLETEPERGARCDICIAIRMRETAEAAKKLKFDYFGTTLSVSSHKDYEMIKNIGLGLATDYDLKFLAKDFKGDEGYKKSVAKSKELELYRQNYCGCEFAKK